MAKKIQEFMPLAMQHLENIADDNILLANIRRAIGELCLAAPIFQHCAPIETTAEVFDMQPLVDNAKPAGDPHDWELGAVLRLRVGENFIDRFSRIDAQGRGRGGPMSWDYRDSKLYLRGFTAAASGGSGVWARPPDNYSPRPVLPAVEFFAPGSIPVFGRNYAFGGDADGPALFYTLRRAVNAPPPSPPDNAWIQNGQASDIWGWRVFAPDSVPANWVLAAASSLARAEAFFSIAPIAAAPDPIPDSGETYPDDLLRKYGGAIAAGALARMPINTLPSRTPIGFWEQKWKMERNSIIGREIGAGARQIDSASGVNTNFPRSGYRT